MTAARILVVEDTPHNMDLMRYLLAARGYTIDEAPRGSEGVKRALAHRPDLVILDLGLPDCDGFEVLRRLRVDPGLVHVPVIAVTAFAMVGDRDRVLAAGFDGYIPKPIEPQTFVTQVESYLGPQGRTAPARAERRPPEETGPARVPGRATVLVVDNVADNLELARSILEPSGYLVVTAGSVAAARERLGERVPDAIVSDVHMPGADGYALLRHVRADDRTRDIPFTFLSSTYKTEADADRALSLGADDFILRPLDPQQLLDRVERLVAGSSGGRGRSPA